MGNHRLLVVSIVTILLAGMFAGSGTVSNVAADGQTVNFTVHLESIGLVGGFSAVIDWPAKMDVARGDIAAINYDIEAASGSIKITIPLSTISFGLVADQSIIVPLPETPVGTVSIPILQYLAQIPTSLASLNINIQGAVSLQKAIWTCDASDIISENSELEWTSWGTKSFKLQTHSETQQITVTTTFGYALSIGVSGSVLGMSMELIHPVQIAAVNEQGSHATVISGVDPFPTWLLVVGVIGAVAIIGGFLYYRRSGRVSPMPPETVPIIPMVPTSQPIQPPVLPDAKVVHHGAKKIPKPETTMAPLMYCPACGADLRIGDGFCMKCGRRFI